MFGTIRRHTGWLWGIIIAAMCVSLLYWTDQRTTRGASGRGAKGPEINGKVMTPQMIAASAREVRLLYFLNFHKWPEDDTERAQQLDFDVEREAWLRLFRVGKTEEAGIRISDQTVAEVARRLLGDYPIDKFAHEILQPHGLTVDDFERFVRNDAAIQQLSAVVGAAGRLITPAEAEALFRREHEEVAGDIAFFHLSNYLSKVVITNGALTSFYTQQMARYRVPDKVRVSYIEFSKSNFIADAETQFGKMTNLTAALRDLYIKAGPDKFKDTNGTVLSETNALEKIREDQRDKLAMMLANRKANEFANKLYDQQQASGPVGLDTFEKLAASNSLQAKLSMPFDREDSPTNLDVSPKFVQTAFTLDLTNNAVSFTPLEGENGFYIIALKEKIPGRFETYEEVASKVIDDYKHYNAFTLAYSDATNFISRATNSLAQGKTFEEVAQQSNIKVETLPPISKSTESLTNLDERLDVRRLKSIVFSLEPGKVSSYIPNPPDGGFVVYVRAKLPFDEAKLRDELPKFTAEMRYHKQNEIFNVWFQNQVNKEAWLKEMLERHRNNKASRPT